MYILSHTPIQSFSSPINCFIVHWHIEKLPFLKLPIASNSLINYIVPDFCLDFYSPIQLKRTLQNNKGKPEGLSITSRHWRVLLTALARGLFIYSSSDAVHLWEQFWKANFPLLLEADLLAGDGCAVCSIWLYFKCWKPKYWFRIVSLFFLLLKALAVMGEDQRHQDPRTFKCHFSPFQCKDVSIPSTGLSAVSVWGRRRGSNAILFSVKKCEWVT